ncbi:unnamed protein product [Mytilus coruscus]|uniref:VWFD domain-containing protein n=1 Tax=Mytilus coruscus TaxID=42192 RepID=A0A6J8EGL9_MYTCO|nr:unnamed protein product [Mytilus coruscus]
MMLLWIYILPYLFRVEAQETTKILYSNRDKILLLYTDTLSETEIADPSSQVIAVDYHPEQNLIFWTGIEPPSISRLHFSLIDNKTTAVNVIISEDIQNPEGIAVDPIRNHVYWTDSGTDQIVRANLDGSNRTTIINSNLEKPRAIELDPSNEKIYFSDWGSNPKIERCNFDGSDRQAIVTTDIYWPNGIALAFMSEIIVSDFTEERLFWCDAQLHQIKSANFDGTDVQLIRKSSFLIGHPLDIEVDRNHLYFGDWNHDALFKISKVSQSSPELIVEIQPNDPMGLKIYRSNIGNCYNYVTITNEEKRSTGYSPSSPKKEYFSDEGLEPGWYRIISENGDHMPISNPGVEKCGTKNPIWLNGTLPTEDDGVVTKSACVQTMNSECENSFLVNIKLCQGYYIYYLRNTTKNSSYCFGEGPVKCDKGLESESGYYPGCASSFPNETLIPEVQPFLKENITYQEQTSPSLRTIFRCKFEDISNGEYVYDVYWYINGNNVSVHLNIPYSNINTTDLLDTEWEDQYNMNMKVKCAIKLRYVRHSIPGPFLTSSVFNAGFFADAYEYSITEGEILNIAFTSTVPVGCFISLYPGQKQCSQNIYISTPTQQQTCANHNNIQRREIVFSKDGCGMELPSLNWTDPLHLEIRGYSDGIYNDADRKTYIRLFTNPIASYPEIKIWRNLTVPEITVRVLDKDNVLHGRLCQSYNDPHLKTFDGRYYDYMNVGEFVMYRNDKGPFWVHALFSSCGSASCNCGVAVRSRRSLFVIRTCREISRTHFNYFPQPRIYRINCDESDMFVETRTNEYIVTLPTGAEIRIGVSFPYINPITIKPSIYDIGETEGLCGYLSESISRDDDFKRRDGITTYDIKDFGDSWKIHQNGPDTLFKEEPEILSQGVEDTDPLKRYCICEKEAKSTDPFNQFNSLECNLTTEFCSSETRNAITGFPSICTSGSRKRRSSGLFHRIYRRSTTDSDDVTELEPLTYNEDVLNTEIPVYNKYIKGYYQISPKTDS